MRFKGFVGPTYTLQDVSIDCQRCVNLYPELNELQTQANGEVGALLSIPGLERLATLGDGPIRGLFYVSSGRLAVVSGNGVYKVNRDWTYSLAGTLKTYTGPVGMADNTQQICIVDGENGYILSLADGKLYDIPNFDGATNVVYQDGYFLKNTPSTGQWGISAQYDGMTWDALDFATAEGNPDNLVTLLSDRRQVWLFGSRTAEVWFNSGSADFPFSRIDGAYIEYGCAAPFTAVKFANSVVWLGDGPSANGVVWMAQGYQPHRISNHAVEIAIQACGNLANATAYSYQSQGHNFYVLNLPGASTSWVYDISTGLWHERAYMAKDGGFERHRGENYAFAYDTDVVGDYENGNIYALRRGVYTDDGNPLVRMRRAPRLSADLKRMFFHSFQLDCRAGVGLDGGVFGADPQVVLRYSDDSGNTWSNEQARPLGALGNYAKRVIWRRLGQSRNRVFEVKVSDPVDFTILGAELDVVQGAA